MLEVGVGDGRNGDDVAVGDGTFGLADEGSNGRPRSSRNTRVLPPLGDGVNVDVYVRLGLNNDRSILLAAAGVGDGGGNGVENVVLAAVVITDDVFDTRSLASRAALTYVFSCSSSVNAAL